MTFVRQPDGRVLLDMASEEYDELKVLFGDILSYVVGQDQVLFYRALRFINRMHRTDDKFKRYDIPEEFREPMGQQFIEAWEKRA